MQKKQTITTTTMHRFAIKLRKLILGSFSQEIINPVQDFSLKNHLIQF